MIGVGLSLPPDAEALELLAGALPAADYYVVAPETLWRQDERGNFVPNGFHRRFLELKRATRTPFVAHGVGLSVGTAAAQDGPRRRRWLSRIREDHRAFRFRWYSDHLGTTAPAGLALTLPLPVPMTSAAASLVRRRLRALQQIVPDVALENTAQYFLLGAPLDEPAFLQEALRGPRMHLLLDLHNLHTMALNFGFAAEEYLERLDPAQVIEIHISGGSESDPGWLRAGRALRLDSHDAAVPEEVWRLLESFAPRCPRLRGVTLERIEGSFDAAGARNVGRELRRLRRFVA